MSVFDPGFASGGAARSVSRTNLNLACLANAASLKQPSRYVMGRQKVGGTTQAEALGCAQVTVCDRAKIYAWEGASITACGNAIVIAADRAQIIAQEYSNIVATDNVTVHARDNSAVEALGKSTVYASGNAHIKALESSIIYASGKATVEVASLTGCTIYLSEGAQIVAKSGKARIIENA